MSDLQVESFQEKLATAYETGEKGTTQEAFVPMAIAPPVASVLFDPPALLEWLLPIIQVSVQISPPQNPNSACLNKNFPITIYNHILP